MARPRRSASAATQSVFAQHLDELLTVTEAAELYSYHPRTIRDWCAARRVAARRTACGHWLISRPSIEFFLRVRSVNPPELRIS